MARAALSKEKAVIDLFTPRGGDRVLTNRSFERVSFEDFSVLARPGTSAIISDVSFLSCAVSPGTCLIAQGAVLERVVFNDFDCGDAMHISSAAQLNGVTICGSRPRMVWLRPDVSASKADSNPSLDLAEYLGHVSITGVGTDRLSLNRNRHFIVRASWLETVDWLDLGLPLLSFWRLMAKKIAAEQSQEGVFTIPNNARYAATLAEFQVLRQQGIAAPEEV